MDHPTFTEYKQDIQNICIDVYSIDEQRNDIRNKMYTLGPIVKNGIHQSLSQGFNYDGQIVLQWSDCI